MNNYFGTCDIKWVFRFVWLKACACVPVGDEGMVAEDHLLGCCEESGERC